MYSIGQTSDPANAQSFFWKNFNWILISSFVGCTGFWFGWQAGKVRCGIKGSVKSVRDTFGAASQKVSETVSGLRKKVGLRKNRRRKNK